MAATPTTIDIGRTLKISADGSAGLSLLAWRMNSLVSSSDRRSQKLIRPRTPPTRKPIRQPQSSTWVSVSELLMANASSVASSTPVFTQKKMTPEEKPALRGAVSTT